MSCRVLVIPEDPTYNGAILKPLVTRMMEQCGKANAKVTVLTNPRARGYAHVKSLVPGIVDRYDRLDLLLFLVDADGCDRGDEFRELETGAASSGVKLLCCAAVQEVEAWLLAGHVDRLGIPWKQVRADRDVKENLFFSFLRQYGDSRRPGGGRDLLMNETLANYEGLLSRCPELAELEVRIRQAIAGDR